MFADCWGTRASSVPSPPPPPGKARQTQRDRAPSPEARLFRITSHEFCSLERPFYRHVPCFCLMRKFTSEAWAKGKRQDRDVQKWFSQWRCGLSSTASSRHLIFPVAWPWGRALWWAGVGIRARLIDQDRGGGLGLDWATMCRTCLRQEGTFFFNAYIFLGIHAIM